MKDTGRGAHFHVLHWASWTLKLSLPTFIASIVISLIAMITLTLSVERAIVIELPSP